jgi:hypothetical protein
MKLNSKGVDLDLCPANRGCDYAPHCKNAEVHNQCSLFREAVLQKLGMTEFPVLADLEEYKMKAFPLKN